MDQKSQVNDIQKSCLEYENKLMQLIHSLDNSISIVNKNAENSSSNVEEFFNKFSLLINDVIKHKKQVTLDEIVSYKSKTVESLSSCKKLVEDKLVNTENILEECKILKDMKIESSNFDYKLAALNKMTSAVGSLPEVPAAHNLPIIRTQLNRSLQDKVKHSIKQMCHVTCSSPVQITSCKLFPGSALIHWQEVNDEIDNPEFILRLCSGDKSKENQKYNIVYKGQENSFMVRHLDARTCYSFQVAYSKDCADFGFDEEMWSYPFMLSSTLPHYSFSKNAHYSISHDGREACKVKNSTEIVDSLLMSMQCQKSEKHSILFKVLQSSDITSNGHEGIGLLQTTDNAHQLWCNHGSIVLSLNGSIYVNGKAMTTKLAKLIKGSNVAFNLELVKSGCGTKLRVCIEMEDKQVTFDWTSTLSHTNDFKFAIHFTICLHSQGWKVKVQ